MYAVAGIGGTAGSRFDVFSAAGVSYIVWEAQNVIGCLRVGFSKLYFQNGNGNLGLRRFLKLLVTCTKELGLVNGTVSSLVSTESQGRQNLGLSHLQTKTTTWNILTNHVMSNVFCVEWLAT